MLKNFHPSPLYLCLAAAQFHLRLRCRAESFGGQRPRTEAVISSSWFCCLGIVKADRSQIARRLAPYCSVATKRLKSALAQTQTTNAAAIAMITPLMRWSKCEPWIGNNCQETFIMVWKTAAAKTLLPVLL